MDRKIHQILVFFLGISLLAPGAIGWASPNTPVNSSMGIARNALQGSTGDVEVSVDLDRVSGTSSFSTGMTHIDHSLRSGDATAITNVKNLLAGGLVFQNTFIMAWGPPDPWPDPASPEPTNWDYLDHRVSLMVETGAIPVISLMNAPWWMKGQLQANGTTKLIPNVNGEWGTYTYKNSFTDYRGITYPARYVSPDPYSARILDNQMDYWLHLVKRVGERYMVAPYNVRYFQVWNELKGYYNNSLSKWDYEDQAGDSSGYNAKHGYTYMYNRVYQTLRDVAIASGIDPNSIMVGGAYPVIKTWASTGAGGFPAQEPLLQNKSYGTYDQRDLDVVKYWLQHKTGAGFITVDASARNREDSNLVDVFTANDKFSDILSWIRSLDNSTYPGAGTLPVFYAEWYTNPYNSLDREYNNAVKADAIIKSIKAGTGVILTWGGVEKTTNWMTNPSMYTNTDTASGGQPLPWYFSYKAFRDYFGPGTVLLSTTQSSPDISVLASPLKTMLVNKTNSSLTISVNGEIYSLAAYEVRVIDTTRNPLPTHTPEATPSPTEITIPTETSTETILPTDTPEATFTRTPSQTPTPVPSTPTPIPDATSPTITILSPANNSIVPRGRTVTILADASDNVEISRVDFTVTGQAGNYACTATSAPYSCAWPVPGRPGSAYTIRASAFDLSGNSAGAQIQVTSSR